MIFISNTQFKMGLSATVCIPKGVFYFSKKQLRSILYRSVSQDFMNSCIVNHNGHLYNLIVFTAIQIQSQILRIFTVIIYEIQEVAKKKPELNKFQATNEYWNCNFWSVIWVQGSSQVTFSSSINGSIKLSLFHSLRTWSLWTIFAGKTFRLHSSAYKKEQTCWILFWTLVLLEQNWNIHVHQLQLWWGFVTVSLVFPSPNVCTAVW